MITAVIVGIAAFFSIAMVIAAIVVVAFLVMRKSRSPVPAAVRKQLNRDLDEALEKKQLAEIKREWMKSDGWQLDAED